MNALFENVHPKGYTPIGDKLEALLSDYLQNLESAQRERDSGNIHALKQIKPVNFIVITDGIPSMYLLLHGFHHKLISDPQRTIRRASLLPLPGGWTPGISRSLR